jgi:Bacteriocin-protection, YdeI or OmpD-Associated/Domain of unknown function (DUF1905)
MTDQSSTSDLVRRFRAVVTVDGKGRLHLPVPFDPDEAWGTKSSHHVSGAVDGCQLRGAVSPAVGGGHEVVLGPAWNRHGRPADGTEVEAHLAPEGPQRADLAPDVAAALDASPEAGAFFDSLAQFYRRGYLRWVDATKRRPDQRPVRIAEMIRLLEDGRKERP